MLWALAGSVMLAVMLAALARRQQRLPSGQPVPHAEPQPDVRDPARPAQASPPAGGPQPTALKSCPVCLSEYPTQNRYCVRDGAPLAEGPPPGPFAQGMICPTCRRGYPPDAGFCPEDAEELVPYGLYGAASSTRPKLRLDASKICPECGVRHAAAHLFCRHDGAELVVVN